jgi:hypothetical protein
LGIPPAWQQTLDFCNPPLVIDPSPSQLASVAGLRPSNQFGVRSGFTFLAFFDTLPRHLEVDLDAEAPERKFELPPARKLAVIGQSLDRLGQYLRFVRDEIHISWAIFSAANCRNPS